MNRIIILLLFFSNFSYAKPTGLPIPRFASLKSAMTNVRVGPSSQHQIKWVYHRKGYPVKIIAEFDHWRKISDIDGEIGWVHEAMLSGIRQVLIINNKLGGGFKDKQPSKELLLMRKPIIESQPLVRVQVGSICKLIKCKIKWCEINCNGYKGWSLKENFWGTNNKDENRVFKSG